MGETDMPIEERVENNNDQEKTVGSIGKAVKENGYKPSYEDIVNGKGKKVHNNVGETRINYRPIKCGEQSNKYVLVK